MRPSALKTQNRLSSVKITCRHWCCNIYCTLCISQDSLRVTQTARDSRCFLRILRHRQQSQSSWCDASESVHSKYRRVQIPFSPNRSQKNDGHDVVGPDGSYQPTLVFRRADAWATPPADLYTSSKGRWWCCETCENVEPLTDRSIHAACNMPIAGKCLSFGMRRSISVSVQLYTI